MIQYEGGFFQGFIGSVNMTNMTRSPSHDPVAPAFRHATFRVGKGSFHFVNNKSILCNINSSFIQTVEDHGKCSLLTSVSSITGKVSRAGET